MWIIVDFCCRKMQSELVDVRAFLWFQDVFLSVWVSGTCKGSPRRGHLCQLRKKKKKTSQPNFRHPRLQHQGFIVQQVIRDNQPHDQPLCIRLFKECKIFLVTTPLSFLLSLQLSLRCPTHSWSSKEPLAFKLVSRTRNCTQNDLKIYSFNHMLTIKIIARTLLSLLGGRAPLTTRARRTCEWTLTLMRI